MPLRSTLLILLALFALNTLYVTVSLMMGRTPPVIMFMLVTLLPFTVAILHAGKRLGWRGMLTMLGITFAVSLLFESVGVATGLIYGPYYYTDQLGPKFLGLVPLFVPLGWFLMSYPSFVIADWITPASWSRMKRALAVAALGALAMTAWDVVLDPVRVSTGMWVWEVDGPYFGVPLQNYWGWWLTTFVALFLFMILTRYTPDRRSPSFDRLVLVSYALIGLTEIISALVLGLGGPALAGFFAMLPWVLWGWTAMRQQAIGQVSVT
jgi:putative membrane protein